MTTPLVDPEGFPRADIDVYAVRHARVSLNRLRNDHRDVVDRLGRALEQVYAVGAVIEPRANGVEKKMVNGDVTGSSSTATRPLARVNMVSENSPSAAAVSPAHSPPTTQSCRLELIRSFAGTGTWRPHRPIRGPLFGARPRPRRYRPTRHAVRRRKPLLILSSHRILQTDLCLGARTGRNPDQAAEGRRDAGGPVDPANRLGRSRDARVSTSMSLSTVTRIDLDCVGALSCSSMHILPP
jgi:hypothetical protein